MKSRRKKRVEIFPERRVRQTYKDIIRRDRYDLRNMREGQRRTYCLLHTASLLGCSVETVRKKVPVDVHCSYTWNLIK